MLNWIYGLAAKLRQKLSEKGQGMVEYALILAAVAIIAVVAIWGTNGGGGLKATIQKSFSQADEAIKAGNTKTQTNSDGNIAAPTG